MCEAGWRSLLSSSNKVALSISPYVTAVLEAMASVTMSLVSDVSVRCQSCVSCQATTLIDVGKSRGALNSQLQVLHFNQSYQIWHPNWVRLARNGTNLGF